jgi:hypothetical protein
MSILQFTKQLALTPEQLRVIVTAYERARVQLDPADRDGPLAEALAKEVIELAKEGSTDASEMTVRALQILAPKKDMAARQ